MRCTNFLSYILVFLITNCSHKSNQNFISPESRDEVFRILEELGATGKDIEELSHKTVYNLKHSLKDASVLLDIVGIEPMITNHPQSKIYRAFFFSRFDFNNPHKLQILRTKISDYVHQHMKDKKPLFIPKDVHFNSWKKKVSNVKIHKKMAMIEKALMPNYENSKNRRIASDLEREDAALFTEILTKFANLPEEERREKEESFIRLSVMKIRSVLRLAMFMSEYYVACLEDDEKWIKDNITSGRANRRRHTRRRCSGHLEKIRKSIEDGYPQMRKWLVIYHHRHIYDKRHSPRREGESYGDWETRLIAVGKLLSDNKHLMRHLFPNLVGLPNMTLEEVTAAHEIYVKNESIRQSLANDDEIQNLQISEDDPELVCTDPSVNYISCYGNLYKELLLGNKDKRVNGKEVTGTPLLGFVTSATPSDQELKEAINTIKSNTLDILNKIERKYYDRRNNEGELRFKDKRYDNKDRMVFRGANLSIEDNSNLFNYIGFLAPFEGNEEYKNMLEIAVNTWEAQEFNKLMIEVAGMVTWAIGCYAIFRTPLARGICELPIGLGANIYFFVVDNSAYQDGLKASFYRPDSNRPSFPDIDRLDSLAFNKLISAFMLPFFTGVPQILKAR